MKPEEALMRVGKAQERTERMARGRGGRAQLASYANEAEALRIVLAMAKAAQAMAIECDNAAIYIAQGTPNAAAGPVARALAEFRKASGGDVPEGPTP